MWFAVVVVIVLAAPAPDSIYFKITEPSFYNQKSCMKFVEELNDEILIWMLENKAMAQFAGECRKLPIREA